MPKDITQDPKFSVGNASRNASQDVLYIKSLLFGAPSGSPTALTEEERLAISETSGICEPAMIKALARIQNASVPSEKASGGRVVGWSKTLTLLQKYAKVGLVYAAVDNTQEVLLDLARKSEAILDKARSEALGGVQIKTLSQLSASGKAGTKVGGTANVGASATEAILDIDLTKWVQDIQALRTPYKVTGGIGGQAGADKWGGGAGTVEITNTDNQETKTYAMYFGSIGASRAKVSFSISTPSHPSGALTHIYRGPLRKKPSDFDSFGGTFVALSGGVAGQDGMLSGSVTIYFFGFSIFDFRPGLNPGWEVLQKCAGITIVWGASSGATDTFFDAGVQFQTGKLLGKWSDLVAN